MHAESSVPYLCALFVGQVKTYWIHSDGGDVIQHMVDNFLVWHGVPTNLLSPQSQWNLLCPTTSFSSPREGSVVNIAASGENFKLTLGLKGKRQSWSINTMHTNLTRAGSTCTCYRCWSADVILQVTFFYILSSRSCIKNSRRLSSIFIPV